MLIKSEAMIRTMNPEERKVEYSQAQLHFQKLLSTIPKNPDSVETVLMRDPTCFDEINSFKDYLLKIGRTLYELDFGMPAEKAEEFIRDAFLDKLKPE